MSFPKLKTKTPKLIFTWTKTVLAIVFFLSLANFLTARRVFAEVWNISYDDQFNSSGDLSGWSVDSGAGNVSVNTGGGFLHMESNWGATYPMVWRNDLYGSINANSRDYAVEVRFRRTFLSGYGSAFGVGTSSFTGARFSAGDPTPTNIYENILHNEQHTPASPGLFGGNENICAGVIRRSIPVDYNWHVGRIEFIGNTAYHYFDGNLVGTSSCRSSIPTSTYFGNSTTQPNGLWSPLDIDYLRVYTGTPSCSFTSTTVSMASGACGSGNPFQNPLTVNPGTTTICIKPYNSAGQEMQLSVDGIVIKNDADSGSQTNYYGLTPGTHIVTASWAGNQQYCASSDTGTVTEPACTIPAITTYFSPNNGLTSISSSNSPYNQSNPYPVTLGQTVSISANSTSGNLTALGLVTPSGNSGGAINPPISNNQWYPESGSPISTLGNYSVTATGGGVGGYCTGTNTPSTTAYFKCQGYPPTITALAPSSGSTLTVPPSSFTWSRTNFGQDQCGFNNTGNDSLKITLYNAPDGGGTGYEQCNYPLGSSPTASSVTSCPFANNFSFPVNGGPYHYSWKIDADNGASDGNGAMTPIVINFNYNPGYPAWWLTDSGYVFAQNHVGSLIPSTCIGNCYFNNSAAGSAAVVSYSGLPAIDPNANFNSASNVSVPQWLALNPFNARTPSYRDFFRQIPPVSSSVSFETFTSTLNHGVIQSTCNGSNTECYLQYNGSMSGFNTAAGSLDVESNKVVIFIDNGATPITLKSFDPGVTYGKGFFGLIASGPIQIDDSGDTLNGLYFTDSTFSTCTSPSCSPEKQLTVTGSVIAKGGVNLLRDLGYPANKTTPAEIFNYDPTIPFTLPRALRRLQFQINELPPTQ